MRQAQWGESEKELEMTEGEDNVELNGYLGGLRETLPAALDSVSSATIHRQYLYCMRIIDAHGSGATYGTKEFKERVYKSHRQISDKSKW